MSIFDSKKTTEVIIKKSKLESIFIFFKSLFFIILILFLILSIFDNEKTQKRADKIYEFSNNASKNINIAMIEVDGIIGNAGFGGVDAKIVSAEKINELIKQAELDKKIDSIVISVNSTGGTVLDSNKIKNKIKRSKKDIYVIMNDFATSGGYLISAYAKKIYAYDQTITGNIGVKLDLFQISKMINNLGIEMISISSGENKNMGSPFKEITTQEKEIFTEIIENEHNNFIKDVAEGRKIPLEDAKKISDGRIFSGTQAKSKNLIDDTVIDFEDFISKVATDKNANKISLYKLNTKSFIYNMFHEMNLKSFINIPNKINLLAN